ncbi:MAG: hypothetical protein PF445_03185 [Melioribacteraceae bacterium]|jgi:hypothetical protein|nr:hypothetical protein [Melioribacteraceae bacterium]
MENDATKELKLSYEEYLFRGLPIYDEMTKLQKIENTEEKIFVLRRCKETLEKWKVKELFFPKEELTKESLNALGEVEKLHYKSMIEKRQSALERINHSLAILENEIGMKRNLDIKYFHCYRFTKKPSINS